MMPQGAPALCSVAYRPGYSMSHSHRMLLCCVSERESRSLQDTERLAYLYSPLSGSIIGEVLQVRLYELYGSGGFESIYNTV